MKAKVKNAAKKAAEPQKPASPQSVPLPNREMSTAEIEMLAPPPGDLLHEAEQESNRRVLRDYFEVIRTLREKGFSFREIAEWLEERGVLADHNAVYRVFTNKMSPQDAVEEEERDREDALDEADQH